MWCSAGSIRRSSRAAGFRSTSPAAEGAVAERIGGTARSRDRARSARHQRDGRREHGQCRARACHRERERPARAHADRIRWRRAAACRARCRETWNRRVLIPVNAGVGSAVGLLRAPVAYEIVRGRLMRLYSFDAAAINRLFAEMRAEAEAIVKRGAGGGRACRAALRLHALSRAGPRNSGCAAGARHSIPPTAQHSRACSKPPIASFTAAAIPGAEIEILSWALSLSAPAEGRLAPPPRNSRASRSRVARAACSIRRAGNSGTSPIYWRSELAPGACVRGPGSHRRGRDLDRHQSALRRARRRIWIY